MAKSKNKHKIISCLKIKIDLILNSKYKKIHAISI